MTGFVLQDHIILIQLPFILFQVTNFYLCVVLVLINNNNPGYHLCVPRDFFVNFLVCLCKQHKFSQNV